MLHPNPDGSFGGPAKAPQAKQAMGQSGKLASHLFADNPPTVAGILSSEFEGTHHEDDAMIVVAAAADDENDDFSGAEVLENGDLAAILLGEAEDESTYQDDNEQDEIVLGEGDIDLQGEQSSDGRDDAVKDSAIADAPPVSSSPQLAEEALFSEEAERTDVGTRYGEVEVPAVDIPRSEEATEELLRADPVGSSLLDQRDSASQELKKAADELSSAQQIAENATVNAGLVRLLPKLQEKAGLKAKVVAAASKRLAMLNDQIQELAATLS